MPHMNLRPFAPLALAAALLAAAIFAAALTGSARDLPARPAFSLVAL